MNQKNVKPTDTNPNANSTAEAKAPSDASRKPNTNIEPQSQPADGSRGGLRQTGTNSTKVQAGSEGPHDGSEGAPSPSLTVDFAVESVAPTGNGRDTSTVVLRPAKNSDANRNFARQFDGRISLADVREEVAAQFRGAHAARVTFEPIKRAEGEAKNEAVY